MSTQYTNTLQFASEWGFNINWVWLNVTNSTDGPQLFYISNIGLVPNGPDMPNPGISISSWKGVPDYWSIAFQDASSTLYCSKPATGPSIKNASGPNDIQVEFNTSSNDDYPVVATITMQDGSSGGTIPMYVFGAPPAQF